MITDLPTRADFEESGIAFLNLAWGNAVRLVLELEHYQIGVWGEEGEISDEYWAAAQRPLATALALAQQGIEFLLKGRIAEVSPFLLISGSPDKWPRGCNKRDVAFANFRTIDAQDLIRAHDAVAQKRLPEEFKIKYEKLRQIRNTILHTVDKRMRITTKDVLLTILEASHSLVGPEKWIPLRRELLEKEPASFVWSDPVEYFVVLEVTKTIETLKLSEAKRLLGFNKRQRRYICYNCAIECRDYGDLPKLAQLRPNVPGSTNLYCIACGANTKVSRLPCRYSDCKSNVIEAEDKICLVCYRKQ